MNVQRAIFQLQRGLLPLCQSRVVYYRSYKHFDEDIFVKHVNSIPFYAAEIFYGVNDMSWFTGKLLFNAIEKHAPVRCKKIKCESVRYMNSQLSKATRETWPVTYIKSTGTSIGKKTVGKE